MKKRASRIVLVLPVLALILAGCAVLGESSARKLVALDASTLSPGPLASWTNGGSLGGQFLPGSSSPVAETVGGRAAVTFSGKDDFLRSSFAVPEELSGGRSFTVVAWVLDPAVGGKKTVVSWAEGTERSAEVGIGRGRNAAFFSSHLRKAGFTGGVPQKGQWHHLGVVFDGARLGIYLDGRLNAGKDMDLDVRPGEAVRIGAAWNASRRTPAFPLAGSLASLEIHASAFSAKDMWKAAGRTGAPPAEPPPTPYVPGPSPRPDPSAPVDAEDEATFFISSDLHYGVSVSVAKAVAGTIDEMNALPGTAFPEAVGGGPVPRPRSLALLGDLVDDGNAADAGEAWGMFAADFGLNGEGRAAYPAYEGVGNHDGDPDKPVRRGVAERNPLRPGVRKISGDGLHYSWDGGGVHFVQLNLFPGSAGDDIINPWGQKFQGEWKYPRHSLEFLKDDLAECVGSSGRPVILFQHYGWDEWSRGWWSDDERTAFREAVRPYNILGIFWGHSHSVQRIDWEGLRTWCVGSGQYDPAAGVFFVVRVTPGEMIVAERRIGGWGYAERIPLK